MIIIVLIVLICVVTSIAVIEHSGAKLPGFLVILFFPLLWVAGFITFAVKYIYRGRG